MTSHHLRVERPSDGVALLVLDNPDQRTAMSDAMTEAWSAAVRDVAPYDGDLDDLAELPG